MRYTPVRNKIPVYIGGQGDKMLEYPVQRGTEHCQSSTLQISLVHGEEDRRGSKERGKESQGR